MGNPNLILLQSYGRRNRPTAPGGCMAIPPQLMAPGGDVLPALGGDTTTTTTTTTLAQTMDTTPSTTPSAASAGSSAAGIGWALLSTASMALSAYHGGKRNHGSIGWAIAWGGLGAMFPILTPVVAAVQGFAVELPPEK